MVTFMFQMLLVSFSVLPNLSFDREDITDEFILLNGSRFICIYLLHISIIPEIKSALAMMKFIKHNSNEFSSAGIMHPFLCALMKMVAGVFTEIMSVIMIMSSTDIADVVKDFIAFNVIKEIDNMMVMTVSNCDVEAEFDKADITYPESQNYISSRKLIRKLEENKCDVDGDFEFSRSDMYTMYIIIAINDLLDFFYTVLYFYFFPFLFFVILIYIFAINASSSL